MTSKVTRRGMLQGSGAIITAAVCVPSVSVAAEFAAPTPTRAFELQSIMETVGSWSGVTVEQMLSPERTRPIVFARQHAMYVAYLLTVRSLPELGRRFGGRDHTTVLHAVRKIDRQVHDDTFAAEDVDFLLDRCIEARRADGCRIDWSRTSLGNGRLNPDLPGARLRGFEKKAFLV